MKNTEKERQENLLATFGVGSGEKASVVGVGSNEKEIRFWGFPKRQRSVSLELVTFGSVAPAAMLSSGCGALELRERKNERATGMERDF